MNDFREYSAAFHATNNDILHYGIKGMRWGHRKKPIESNKTMSDRDYNKIDKELYRAQVAAYHKARKSQGYLSQKKQSQIMKQVSNDPKYAEFLKEMKRRKRKDDQVMRRKLKNSKMTTKEAMRIWRKNTYG